MQLEECFLEMVCHARWVFNYCMTRLSAETLEAYRADIAVLQEGLEAISYPHAPNDEALDIPAKTVQALCHGVGYLLLGEDILGRAPPTMHPFLEQTAASRRESSKQAQVIVVRWFINSGLVTVEELLGVIYGPDTTVENYESDYDAHMAVAVSLCSEEPFYLGAHVTILRSLLLHYCTTVFTADDIISHVVRINPTVTAELYTLEDTLLHWVRTVLNLVPSTPMVAYIRDNVSDLYLNTNDGRVLSLIVHYYRPDLIALDTIHLSAVREEGRTNNNNNNSREEVADEDDVEAPLAGWQREANWSNIIHAAEVLGLWVGVFSDEIVTHGFCTLQLHVLRIVEELFAVLAVGAEETMEAIMDGSVDKQSSVRKSVENGPNPLRQSQLVIKSSIATEENNNAHSLQRSRGDGLLHPPTSSTHHGGEHSYASNTAASVSVELDNNTSLVMVTPASPSHQRNALVVNARGESVMGNEGDEGEGEEDNAETAAAIAKALVGNGFETITSPEPNYAKTINELGEERGASSSVRRQIFSSSASQPPEAGGSVRGSLNASRCQQLNASTAAEDKHDDDDEDPLAGQREGDYNIILTNMFLQGIAMPISKRPAPAPKSENNAIATSSDGPQPSLSDEPTFSSSAPKRKPNTAPANGPSVQASTSVHKSLHDTQDLSAFVVKSSRDGGTVVSQVIEVKRRGSTDAHACNDHNASVLGTEGIEGPEMALGTSPVKGADSRPATTNRSRTTGLSRAAGEADDTTPAIKKSLQKLHAKPINITTASTQRSSFMTNVVQGSIHKEGIAELVAELKQVCAVPPPIPVSVSTASVGASALMTSSLHDSATARVRDQNRELRAALERQQQLIAAFLAKVQQGLSDPTSYKEVVRQLGGGSVSPAGEGRQSSQQQQKGSLTQSVAVGASFAGTASPEMSRAAKQRRLPRLKEEDDEDEASAAVANNNKVTPAMLSISKLQSARYCDELDITPSDATQPVLSTTTTNNTTTSSTTLLSTGPIVGHRGPQAQQPLPIIKSLGGVSSLTATAAAVPASLKPTKPAAPPVMDISIDALKSNPAKKERAIPPRLAQRLKAANAAFDAKDGHGQGNVIKLPSRTDPQQPQQQPQQQQGTVPSSAPNGAKLPTIPRKMSANGGAANSGANQPIVRTWNNRSNVTNSLKHALLSGNMNKAILENIMTIMDRCDEDHSESAQLMGGQLQYVILLKDEFAHAFKGLYMLKPDGMLSRLFGVGPVSAYVGPSLATLSQTHPNAPPPSDAVMDAAAASAKMFPKYFKYDTSSKKFSLMPHKEANQTTDAVAFAKITHKINRGQVM